MVFIIFLILTLMLFLAIFLVLIIFLVLVLQLAIFNHFLNIGAGINIDFYLYKDHIHFLSLVLGNNVNDVHFLCLNIGFSHDYSHFLALDLSKISSEIGCMNLNFTFNNLFQFLA